MTNVPDTMVAPVTPKEGAADYPETAREVGTKSLRLEHNGSSASSPSGWSFVPSGHSAFRMTKCARSPNEQRIRASGHTA